MEYFVQIAVSIIGGLFMVVCLVLGWWIKSVEENNKLRMQSMVDHNTHQDQRLNDHGARIGQLYSRSNDLEVTLAQDHYTKTEIRDAINTVADNAVRVLSAQMGAIQRQLDDLRLTVIKRETGA